MRIDGLKQGTFAIEKSNRASVERCAAKDTPAR